MLVGLTLSACDCVEQEVSRVIEDFEACGGDSTCGWEPSDRQSVSLTTTFHPGEHGLLLRGGSAASKRGTVTAEEIHVVSDCRDDLVLHLNDRPFRLQATTEDRQPWYRLAVVVSNTGTDVESLGIENAGSRPCIVDEIRAIDEVCVD